MTTGRLVSIDASNVPKLLYSLHMACWTRIKHLSSRSKKPELGNGKIRKLNHDYNVFHFAENLFCKDIDAVQLDQFKYLSSNFDVHN